MTELVESRLLPQCQTISLTLKKKNLPQTGIELDYWFESQMAKGLVSGSTLSSCVTSQITSPLWVPGRYYVNLSARSRPNTSCVSAQLQQLEYLTQQTSCQVRMGTHIS